MIEILTPDDVSKIKNCYIAKYIKNLFTNLLTQTSDCSLETVGGIFYVENKKTLTITKVLVYPQK